MARPKSFIEELHDERDSWGQLILKISASEKNIQKWLYYPERGPNLCVDFSFSLRGPLAQPICLKVTNNSWEGSHGQIEVLHIEELHAGSSRRGGWGQFMLKISASMQKNKSGSIIPSADRILISTSVFLSADH